MISFHIPTYFLKILVLSTSISLHICLHISLAIPTYVKLFLEGFQLIIQYVRILTKFLNRISRTRKRGRNLWRLCSCFLGFATTHLPTTFPDIGNFPNVFFLFVSVFSVFSSQNHLLRNLSVHDC